MGFVARRPFPPQIGGPCIRPGSLGLTVTWTRCHQPTRPGCTPPGPPFYAVLGPWCPSPGHVCWPVTGRPPLAIFTHCSANMSTPNGAARSSETQEGEGSLLHLQGVIQPFRLCWSLLAAPTPARRDISYQMNLERGRSCAHPATIRIKVEEFAVANQRPDFGWPLTSCAAFGFF